ncbi:MAG: DUF11 domain-containing protein [Methanobacteriaceae archaeon]|nr:DUF11 domain-containing protein [Methanobacteriaceae archaeon]MDO9627812.1 DUF11 domain-containing protein [Methanobacteriaceae archaeon]
MNTTSEATDLAVSITGNASSVGIGDTVHLIISLSNLGPKSCDAKLNYKIPVGLKLLSSQGPGVYDVASGVWSAGLLLVNDTISLDLVLQVGMVGCFNHVVDVFDSLNISNNHMVWSMVCASVLGSVTPTVINSSAFDGLKPIDNGNGGSGSGSGNGGSGNGGNGGNGGGSGGAGGSGNGGKGGGNGGGSDGGDDQKPKPSINKGNGQLYRDQMYIRDYVGYVGSNNHDGSDDQGGSDSQIPSMPDWTLQPPGSEDDKVENGEIPNWVYMALAAGIIIAAVAIKKPEWGTAILNGLRTLWNTMRYFGGSTRYFAEKVLKPNVKNIFKLTGSEDSFNSFSAILDGLNPNVGSTVVKWVLKNGLNKIVSKIAPDFAPSIESSMGMVIDVVFSGINLAEFANDPLGKIENIINIFNPYHGDKQDDILGLTDPRPFG